METKIKIVVDAMGGDYAPEVPVQGAVEALQENTNISIVLVGRTDAIKEQLAKYTYDKERIEIVHAEEVIGFDEPPVMAVRKKKDSSIVVGMKLVKKGEADAFVSAGSTGAILVGGQMIVGRISTIDPNGQRTGIADRLWSKCRCQSFSFGAVCTDGIHIYETRCWSRQS